MSKNAASLFSLARAGFSIAKINKLVEFAKQNKIDLDEMLNFDSGRWGEILASLDFNEDDLSKVAKVRQMLANSSFLLENILSKGISIVTVFDENYPKGFLERLKKYKWPPIIYCKGNLNLLNKKAISVVGSRDASKISLNFTKNITEKFVKDGYVVVSGFARGVDRVAFESALEFGGETVCVLPQGILTFNLQRDYYKYYTQGKILICSTFEPSASWNAGFAMARNDYIYALGEKVFISESKSDGGTWNGAMSAIKHGLKNVFVRYPQEGEDNANLLLVEHGIVPVDICGNIIHIDVKSLEELIVEILSESPGLEVSKIRKKLEKNGKQMSSQKLTHILRKMNKIEYRKEKNRYVYYIKVNKQNFLFDEY